MNRLKNPTLMLLAALAALGCSDTLGAQTVLTVTPASLTFNNAVNGVTSQPQQVSISWNQTITGTATIQANQSWITLSANVLNFNSTPSLLNVSVSPQNLAAGTYSGMITVSVPTAGGTLSQTISVSMAVTGTSLLSASPASLSFTATQGSNSGTPSSIPVTIASSGQALSFTLTAQSQPANWLLLSNSCPPGAPCTTGSASQFSVQVNPSGLATGTYSGNITAQSTTTSDAVTIQVTLTVNASATLSVTPANPPPFVWQTGTQNPAAQQLSVTSGNGGTANFTATVSPAVPWLTVSPLSGSIPGTVSLVPNPAGSALTVGNYTTSVIIASGANSVSVPVTLIVATHPLIQLSNTALTFSGQFAATTPPATQSVQVTASDSSAQGFHFSVTTVGATWLTASTTNSNFASSGNGTTPATLTVQVNPAGLQVGTYTANISVTPTNGDNYTQTIAVTFSVTAASLLEAGPGALLFSYQMGQNPPGAQPIFVTTTGQPLQFTTAAVVAAAPNCPTNWLTATLPGGAASATTPANVTLSASVQGMTQGLCQGAVTLTPSGSANPVIISVTVAITAANQAALAVSMPVTTTSGFGLETAPAGGSSYVRTIALTSTSPTAAADFTAGATSVPAGWLSVGPGFGNTPTNLSVTINPGAITTGPGTYNGTINISSSTISNFTLAVPVVLNLTSNVTVGVAPTSLSFTQAQGGPVPAVQNLTLTSTNGTASFTASIQYTNGSNWLQVSPTSGSASGPVQVSIQQNTLSQGTYNANIILSLVGAAANSITIPVTLTVGPPQTVSASPTSLSFAYTITGATPGSQKITVTSTGGPVAFTVGTTTTGSATGWLKTDITSGNTPMDINVSVNPSGLTAGTYPGSVSISAPTVLASPITVPVQLVVSPAPVPQPTVVRNAASFTATYIAAGEIISIFGSNLGPSTPASFKLNSSGGVDNILAGVQVLFNGNPGTPLYVSATQINIVVPWEINGQTSANIVVSFNSIQSAPLPLAVQTQSPGLFTFTGTGQGQVAATNQDGTYNAASGQGFAPAPQGSVIAVYGTGGGQTTPPGTTGSVTPIPQNASGLLKIPGTITATIGGQPATVQFAGAAPGLVTGVFQINIQVPTGVTGSNLPLTVTINGATTNNISATVAVQ
ncbi:MAG TPA: hypothetical protein VEV85_11550 [Bryobacteraceae bacterium]|nr:hypothetical protein [Bryobacteraceae bacterium]